MAIPWHRIFGMALTQYFAGTAWQVDVEVDLSLQQQRLDLVILRRKGPGTPPRWPDGFGTPADYNLLTFKALQDPLDAWALKELAGHSVNYRKQISPNPDALLPESHFRMLAATMRFPRQLARKVTLKPQGPGAYDVSWGIETIRILVLHEMPQTDQNLVWNLFSGDQERIATAFQRLQPQSARWSKLLNKLLRYYGLEGMPMPYTMADFEREATEDLLNTLTPEQRLQGLSPEQLLSLLPLAEIEKYVKKQKAAKDKDAPRSRKRRPEK
jgi:hypothetical protein